MRRTPAPGNRAQGPAAAASPVVPVAENRSVPATAQAQSQTEVKTEVRSQTQIQLIPAPVDGALDAAAEAVDLLLDSGRAPGEVLVLTTGAVHPWAAHELSFGEASYWAQHEARDDVFYADIASAGRAAARPVVVVAVNDEAGDDLGRALTEARERAGLLLIVCGDPGRINAALGAGV